MTSQTISLSLELFVNEIEIIYELSQVIVIIVIIIQVHLLGRVVPLFTFSKNILAILVKVQFES